MGQKLQLNFGLVHHPPQFDYAFTLEDLGEDILNKLPANTADILESFSEEELHILRWQICWRRMARRKQLPPSEFDSLEKTIWGIRSGRGFGKTLTAANWMGLSACEYPSYYHVVSPTHDDVRYTCFEGPTGLYSCIPPQLIVDRNSGLPSCTLWNGSIIRGFAGDTPERLRGPQCAKAWCDEIASWKYPEEAWSNLLFGLRLGDAPQVVWTGTPKPTPFIRRLQQEPGSIVTEGSTYENRANLTAIFYQNVAKYEGTKIGRQELYGEVLDPEEEGFVKRSQWRMWPANKPLPKFDHIILSLDTAFTEQTHAKGQSRRKKQGLLEPENDPTACSVWGLFKMKGRSSIEQHILLLDAWEDWLGLPELITRVKKEREYTYGDSDEPLIRNLSTQVRFRPSHQGKRPDVILIEDKGSGISLRQSLAAENILTHIYNPGQEDKLTRLHLVSPLWPNGRVWAVESDVNPGKFKTWADPLITQVCSYLGEGSIERDDLLDTTTQALRFLMDRFMDPLGVTAKDHEMARQRAAIAEGKRLKKRNPYD